ncbi:hypothetical protein [Priestia megaterium]|uniref:hypothetical protein n=1 Tax=Priestia megaterium TaxID=1404 RepID=UPI00351B261B
MGRFFSFLYIFYFANLAARVIRDFWRHVIDICLSRYSLIYCQCLINVCCYLYR